MTLAAVVIIVFLVALLGIGRFTRQRAATSLHLGLTEKQQAIEQTLGALGRKLNNSTTTIEAGHEALEIALTQLRAIDAELRALGVQGELPQLIADTEKYFEEWKTSR